MKIKSFVCLAILLAFVSCDLKPDIVIPNYDNQEPVDKPVDPPTDGSEGIRPALPETGLAKVPTLLEPGRWQTKDTVTTGIIFYQFNGMETVTQSRQIVSVVEVDLENPKYVMDFEYLPSKDSTSITMKKVEAKTKKKVWVGVNAAYELEAVYVRVDGDTKERVTLAPTHQRYWKHEAAVFSDGGNRVGIVYPGPDPTAAITFYDNIVAENILASSPMLINDFDPMGERYVPQMYQDNPKLLDSFDGEDPEKHQGVRHPRTVYALTEDNDLLFIVVDGRWSGKAEGMSAAEITRFIKKHFNPRWAINMDGGGSSTLCVAGRGSDDRQIVNFPAQNRGRNPMIQRKVSSQVVIREK